MARTEARMTCAIWDDEDYRALTWEAQWLYETLLTQKDLSLCGVLTYTPKRFAKLARNASAPAIKKALDLLRERRYVVLDDDTDELLVRSLIRRDRVLGNHNSVVGCSKAFEAIHSQVLRDAIVEEVIRVVREGVAVGGTEGGTPTEWLRGLPDLVRKRVGDPFANALALAYARASAGAPVPPASLLLPPLLANTDPPPNSIDAPLAEEEEDQGWQAQVNDVARLVAKRRCAKLTDPPPEGERRNRWLTTTANRLIAEDGATIRDRLAEGMSVAEVVDLFEPPPQPTPPAAAPPSPYPAFGEPAEPVWELDDQGRAVERVAQ